MIAQSERIPSPWFVRTSRGARPRVRLFCFPYAGGGASAYRGWADVLPEGVEVWAAQLPGHETRISERPSDRLDAIVEALARETRGALDLPYALFGHSMGALLAFELARRLAREGAREPERLVVSGHSAPTAPARTRAVHTLPDAELVAEIGELGGTPAEVLSNPELMALMMPAFRADFRVCETYRHEPRPALTCPIDALGGLDDAEAPPESLLPWAAETRGAFSARVFPGGHFFLHAREREVAEAVGARLAGLASGEA